MTAFGGFAKPGQGSAVLTAEREIVPAGFDQQALFSSEVISGTTRDGSAVQLRPGLLLGRLDASPNELEQWDADASTGTQNIVGVLWKELRATDFDGNNTDRAFTVLVGRCPLMAATLLIEGTALVGHSHEYLARRQLRAAGFQLDDDPFGYKAGAARFATVTDASDTLTADENGSTIFYSNAAAVAVTLPALKPGLEFWLHRTADEEFVVASAAGDDIIIGNDLSADSVTFTTAGEQIGAEVHVRSAYVGTTLKWLIDLPVKPFSTDNYLATTFAS